MQGKRTTRRRVYVERICTRCSVPFTTRSDTKQNHCSTTCARSTQAPRTCTRCGQTFLTRRLSDQRFCSVLCRNGTDEQRFWAGFTRRSDAECWLWKKYPSSTYGRMRWRGEMTLAHRISWEIHNGPIPPALLVLHKCPGGGTPRCVNPGHLAVGNHEENADDMMKDGRHWSTTGLWHPPLGEQAAVAVLTEAMVIQARQRVRAGELCKDVATSLGVNPGTLVCAVKGASWKYLIDPPPVRMKRGGGVHRD